MTILLPFAKFHQEAAVIGQILAGYANLEIGMLNCVSTVRDDFDTALKVMFRDRGETRRINIADALGRGFYAALGLETEFSVAIGAVRHCLKARNLYAHCTLPFAYRLEPGRTRHQPMQKNRRATAAEQHREFVKVARELGCDDDEAKFKETLRKIGAQKMKKDKPRQPRRKA
jgi:hypothetical protein